MEGTDIYSQIRKILPSKGYPFVGVIFNPESERGQFLP
jgi:hypothetical protein